MTVKTLSTSHHRLSVNETLEAAKRDGLRQMIIVGFDSEDRLHIRGCNTDNGDSLWFAEQLRMDALGITE